MKKIYLSLIGVFILTGTFSQITLTQYTSIHNIGDAVNLTQSVSSYNVSHSGVNQTWDFSSVSGNTGIMSYNSLLNSNAPTTYPDANLIETIGSSEVYYFQSPSEISSYGFLSSFIKIKYTDKKEYLKFPLTYNTTYNETFSGTMEFLASGLIYNESGTIAIKGDGYGTLILPYTTVNNVLRISVISNYTQTQNGITLSENSDTNYLWFNENNKTFLASYFVQTNFGGVTGRTATILNQADYISSINDASKKREPILTFYPNPAHNTINIKNASGIKSITIHNLQGQIIKTITVYHEDQKVDISDLNSGCYFINYLHENKSYMNKLIIK